MIEGAQLPVPPRFQLVNFLLLLDVFEKIQYRMIKALGICVGVVPCKNCRRRQGEANLRTVIRGKKEAGMGKQNAYLGGDIRDRG